MYYKHSYNKIYKNGRMYSFVSNSIIIPFFCLYISIIIHCCFLTTRTVHVGDRGTLPFLAPETSLAKEMTRFDLDDLQAMDLWALGLIAWSVTNPDSRYPYQVELRRGIEKGQSAKLTMAILHRNGQLPQKSPKYEVLRTGPSWSLLDEVVLDCLKLKPKQRLRASFVAAKLIDFLSNQPKAPGQQSIHYLSLFSTLTSQLVPLSNSIESKN